MKEAMQEGRIKSIKLPTVPIFQVISQYANDTTLTIQREEIFIQNLVDILENFYSPSRLLINGTKLATY
jgi:hypothetical protein